MGLVYVLRVFVAQQFLSQDILPFVGLEDESEPVAEEHIFGKVEHAVGSIKLIFLVYNINFPREGHPLRGCWGTSNQSKKNQRSMNSQWGSEPGLTATSTHRNINNG